MGGIVGKDVRTQEPRPRGELVPTGTGRLYARQTGEYGGAVKGKYRFVDRGFGQIGGLHLSVPSSPTAKAVSVCPRGSLAGRRRKMGMRYVDMEQSLFIRPPTWALGSSSSCWSSTKGARTLWGRLGRVIYGPGSPCGPSVAVGHQAGPHEVDVASFHMAYSTCRLGVPGKSLLPWRWTSSIRHGVEP